MDEMEGVVDYGQEERRDHRAGGEGFWVSLIGTFPVSPEDRSFLKQRWAISTLEGSNGGRVFPSRS